jgi:uncharacterized damage-inducible protein DinB
MRAKTPSTTPGVPAMTLDRLRDLFLYDDWANARLFGAVANLSEDAFARPVTSSFTSIRDTLSHILAEEWLWVRRCRNESPPGPPAWTELKDRGAVLPALEAVREDRTLFLQHLTADDLARVVVFKSLEGHEHAHCVEDMLQHVLNHSTYHRGQAATLMRQLGAVAPETDFVVYCESGRMA